MSHTRLFFTRSLPLAAVAVAFIGGFMFSPAPRLIVKTFAPCYNNCFVQR